MILTEAVADFLMACRADGLRPKTLGWYRTILLQLTDAYPGREVEDFSTRNMREYLVNLRNQTTHLNYNGRERITQQGGLSEDSINGHTRGLHKFWKWCADEYGIQNPMRSIRYPRQPTPHPKPIPPEDAEKLFQTTGDDVAGIRNRAIIAFLLDTGCRAGGLVGLKMQDLDLEARRAIVLEKGQKTRTIVFIEETRQLLREWLVIREPVPYLFYNIKTYEPLHVNGLYQLLKRLADKAGVKRFNPHSFRHTFARGYIKNGGDLATLAKILGHSNVRTTADHYAVFTADEIAERHEKLSPARILGKYRKKKGK